MKPSYRSEDGNIVELLNIKGIEFIKTKEINFEGEIYSEFRNKDKNKNNYKKIATIGLA